AARRSSASTTPRPTTPATSCSPRTMCAAVWNGRARIRWRCAASWASPWARPGTRTSRSTATPARACRCAGCTASAEGRAGPRGTTGSGPGPLAPDDGDPPPPRDGRDAEGRRRRCGRSGAGEDRRDVVTAEAERVVEHGDVALGQLDGAVLRDPNRGLGIEVLDVDRRRRR